MLNSKIILKGNMDPDDSRQENSGMNGLKANYAGLVLDRP